MSVPCLIWRSKWQPRVSHGHRSLAGYRPWGHKSWTQLSDKTTTMFDPEHQWNHKTQNNKYVIELDIGNLKIKIEQNSSSYAAIYILCLIFRLLL